MKPLIFHFAKILIMCVGIALLWMGTSAAGSQTMRDKLQTTIGGAEYRVTGEVVHAEGNLYTLRTSGGETLQLEISDDTNMFCQTRGERSSHQSTSMSGQPSSVRSDHISQMEQTDSSFGVSEKQAQSRESQALTQSKGFRIGDCPFQVGDVVKAELTDQGTVTYIRSVDPQSLRKWKGPERHEAKGSGRSTEEMGLPQEYVFLPAGALGGLNVQDTEPYTVKTADGEDVGNVYRVLLNHWGDPAYIIIRMKENQQLKPLPWQAIQVSPETHAVTLVLSRAQIDQLPGYAAGDMAMTTIQGFWEMAEMEKDRRVSRQQARTHDRFYEGPYEGSLEEDSRYTEYPDRGARPGEAGEYGEVSIFGSPSTLPPGEHAPQYSGADKERYRGDEFRSQRHQGRFERGDRPRDFDRTSRSFRDFQGQRQFDRGHRQPLYDRNQEFRSMRDMNRSDQLSFDRDWQSRHNEFRKQGKRDRWNSSQSSRHSRMNEYDERPETYRP